ncbi:MAG: TonB-dependent receptor [Pseudomonadales bacterium]|nr:TonB-dependent receptor [Pseudomonadales bacterium]
MPDLLYRNENTLRGKLLLVPSDRIRVKATLFGANVDDGYDAFSLDNTRTTLSDQPGRDKQASRALAIDTLVHTSAADVNFIVSAMDTDSIYGYDEDWTYVGIHPDGYSSTDYYFRHRKSWSAELRALSNSSNRIWDDSTDWLVGLYTLSSKEDLLRRYTYLSGDFNSDYDFVTTAAFAQFDTHLTDRLSLSSGARLERRDTHYTDSAAVAFDPVDNLWGVNIALQFQRGAFMSWASIARGYKAGGFNTDGSLDADLRSFGPEYLWEIEVGTKGIIADNLQLQASLFYDLRRDQQVKSSVVRVRADGSTEFIDFFGNAASGTNLGAELEVDFYPTETLGLNMSLGLLKATFDNYINEFGEDLSGRDQAQAPRYTASVSADYRRGGWFVRAGVDARDRFYFSDRHNLRGNAYALVNASAGYEADHWTIRLWGRNLTNRDYYVRGFGSFGNDPRNGYAVEPYLQFGEPRVLGIDFEYRMR